MAEYVITDLTNFTKKQGKPEKVCIGVIDLDTGQCLRPCDPSYITKKLADEVNLQPGTVLEGNITQKPNTEKPHIEDATYEELENVGNVTSDQFKKILQKSQSNSIEEGFCYNFHGEKYIPEGQKAKCSLLTVKVDPSCLKLNVNSHRKGRISATIVDNRKQYYRYLSIADRRYAEYEDQDAVNVALTELRNRISLQDDVYLRIGLTRLIDINDQGYCYWLQVNGIYMFSDLKQDNKTSSIYTIGHSNQTTNELLNLLQQNQVNAIADVRSSPYSSYSPQFNRDRLKNFLNANLIKYVHLGKELGGLESFLEVGRRSKVNYEEIAKTDLFKSALDRVCRGSEKYRIALMCSEKEPLDCHRTLLLAKELEKRGFDVTHINEKYNQKHNPVIENILLGENKIASEEKFGFNDVPPRAKRLEDAYNRAEKLVEKKLSKRKML